jgi:hypothetical protein
MHALECEHVRLLRFGDWVLAWVPPGLRERGVLTLGRRRPGKLLTWFHRQHETVNGFDPAWLERLGAGEN